MIPTRIGESRWRILEQLKRRGSATVPDMARELDLNVETVRTHLKSLGSESLVERRGRRTRGPGRPEVVYGLTERSEALFPSREARLLQELAGFLLEHGGDDLLRGFFEGRARRRRAEVGSRLEGLGDGERLREVARVLSEEGFMAEVSTDDDGRPSLRLCHCPMRNLVDVTKVPCRSELRMVRELLGRRLTRTAYIPSGDSSCCYTIEEAR